MIRAAMALAVLACGQGPVAAQTVTPLFAADTPLRLEIRGPISAIAKASRERPEARRAELVLGSERLPIRLTPRGITRLRLETCHFPPLRVEFPSPPPPASLFSGQGRLKLVTHCRPMPFFQQHVLLEYAAYRLYNLVTPASFRARLATIDYVGEDGRPFVTRVGFFIEDRDDVGRRIGQRPTRSGDTVAVTAIDPAAGARFALFEYMIGNLDWSMRAGPAGEGCCHNSRLFGSGPTGLVPVPYDFDYSGLVDAPYAVQPDGSPKSVRRRNYQGYCSHNAEARVAAGEFRAKRAAMLAEVAAVPGLDPRSQRKAVSYLEQFFAEIATDQQFVDKVLKGCVSLEVRRERRRR